MTKKSKTKKIPHGDIENAFHNFIVEGCNKFTSENEFDGFYIIRGLLDVALCTIMAQQMDNYIKLDLIDALLLRICDFKYKNYLSGVDNRSFSNTEKPPSSEVMH